MTEGGLDLKGREFLEKRMETHERIEKAVQVIDVIKAMSSLTPNPTEEAKSILTGESQAKVNFIVDVVKAYRQEKPKNTITEFFNERYKDRAAVLLRPTDAIRETIRSQPKVEMGESAGNMDKLRGEVEMEARKIREEDSGKT